MNETDIELLQRYAHQDCEEAFAEIVHRQLPLVYSAALRQVRSVDLAEEVPNRFSSKIMSVYDALDSAKEAFARTNDNREINALEDLEPYLTTPQARAAYDKIKKFSAPKKQ